jgi:hypothetical protein
LKEIIDLVRKEHIVEEREKKEELEAEAKAKNQAIPKPSNGTEKTTKNI